MKKVKKIVVICMLTLSMVLFATACGNGALIKTDVVLEDDFSGSRVMEVSISKSTFNQYMIGSIDNLKSLIEKECPEQILWEISETDTSYNCVFTIEFDSLDTYKSKVTEILGEAPVIDAVKADTFLAKGIAYSESFTSMELLSWLSTALVNDGFVDSGYQSDIFESDTTKLYFGTEEYASYENISVSDIEYLPFDNIDILTTPYADGTYDRKVIFHIPQSTMAEKQEEITAYLEEGTPSGAVLTWETNPDTGDTIFTISLEKVSLSELVSAMKGVFHSETSTVASKEITTGINMLQYKQSLTELLDTSQFVSNSYGTASFRYFISSVVTSKIAECYSDGTSQELYVKGSEEYAGFNLAYQGDISQLTLQSDMIISYIPETINVTTKINNNDNIERTTEFIFSDVFSESEAADIQERVNNKVAELAEVSFVTEDSKYKIEFKQKGTEEEVASGFASMFDTQTAKTHYAREKKKMAFHCTSAFEEALSFIDFFGDKVYSVPINYTVKFSMGEKISDMSITQYADTEGVNIKGGTFQMTSIDGEISCTLTAADFNAIAILWWLILIVIIGIVGVVGYFIYLIFKVFYAGRKNKQQEETRYCSKCGEKLSEGTMFCSKCGEPLTK